MGSRLWFACLALVTSLSCERVLARRGLQDDCIFNADCADPLVCAGRRCRAPCRDDRDCANASLCRPTVRTACESPPCAPPLRRVCVEPGGPDLCFSDGDCSAERLCAPDNLCRYRCAPGFDADCEALYGRGARCEERPAGAAVCVSATTAPDASPPTDAAALDAAAPDVSPLDAPLDVASDLPLRDDATDADVTDAGARDLPTTALGCALVRREGACTPGAAGCDVSRFSHGGQALCALISDGTLRCWGDNQEMQIGAGAGICNVPGISHRGPWREVSVGGSHTCAIDPAGQVRCWGQNAQGQCGTGTTSAPLALPGIVVRADGTALTDARAIVASAYHTCALIGADGRVACWGMNNAAQLGTSGAPTIRPHAVEVPGLSGIVGLDAASGVTCAWRADGASWCFGIWMQRADGAASGAPAVGPQRTLFSPVRAIAVNEAVTCALLLDGTAQCAGSGSFGERGDGTTTGPIVTTPRAVVGLTDGEQIVAGASGTCARRRSGEVLCWGAWASNFRAALSAFEAHPSPTVIPFVPGVREVFMGGALSGTFIGNFGVCGLYGGADLRCLGVLPGEGSLSAALPVRVNWTGAGIE